MDWAAISPPCCLAVQNNGVVSLTRCASRHAGLAAAGWLVVAGILAKVAALFATIPNCVLGSMTTFLFACAAISGAQPTPLLPVPADEKQSRPYCNQLVDGSLLI